MTVRIININLLNRIFLNVFIYHNNIIINKYVIKNILIIIIYIYNYKKNKIQ